MQAGVSLASWQLATAQCPPHVEECRLCHKACKECPSEDQIALQSAYPKTCTRINSMSAQRRTQRRARDTPEDTTAPSVIQKSHRTVRHRCPFAEHTLWSGIDDQVALRTIDVRIDPCISFARITLARGETPAPQGRGGQVDDR